MRGVRRAGKGEPAGWGTVQERRPGGRTAPPRGLAGPGSAPPVLASSPRGGPAGTILAGAARRARRGSAGATGSSPRHSHSAACGEVTQAAKSRRLPSAPRTHSSGAAPLPAPLAAACGEVTQAVFRITSNTLVRSSQTSSGQAGGASASYGLGRGAAGPDRQSTTTAAGALRGSVLNESSFRTDPSVCPIIIESPASGTDMTGGPESVRAGCEAERANMTS